MAYLDTQRARQLWASKTVDDLKALKVGGADGLRSLASELGITGHLIQDGKEVKVNSAKKETLVNAIWDSLETERLAEVARQALEAEQAIAQEEVANTADGETLNDLGSTAKTFTERLTGYVDTLWNPANETWKDSDRGLVELSMAIARNLENRVNPKTGERITSDTVKAYKSNLKNFMRRQLDTMPSNPRYQKYEQFFNELMGYVEMVGTTRKYRTGLVDAALSHHTEIKASSQKANLDRRQSLEGISYVSGVTRLYDKARTVLAELSEDSNPAKNSLWADVVIALMLVTGRRQAEILVSAEFSEPQEHGVGWAVFSGQAKTKGREGGDQPFEIPLLAPLGQVQFALAWLAKHDRRVSKEVNGDPMKIAHNRFSKLISAQIKNWDGLVDYRKRGTDKDGKPAPFTGHRCRQVYVLVCKGLVGMSDLASMVYLLGDKDGATAESYQADLLIDPSAVEDVLKSQN
jgi:hypothetical protein